jgi:phospholipid/cholesterol/gamma-HCH transport system permease protein
MGTATTLSEPLARLGRFTWFGLQALGHLPAALVRPGTWLPQLYAMLLGSLPIAAAAGAALGLVAWLQMRGLLFRFGAESALPSALAVAVLWELGPVIAGLIAAARIGAGLGAELGSMQITEQIDALAVLGVSPVRRLVAPRTLACVIALPVLTVVIDYLAIFSGYLAEALGGNMTWTAYQLETMRFLRLADVAPATLKTAAFGYLIGVTGCWCGVHAGTGTEGVGRAATRAVVISMLFVLAADVVLVKAIQIFS